MTVIEGAEGANMYEYIPQRGGDLSLPQGTFSKLNAIARKMNAVGVSDVRLC